ncbi:hypothetical protein MPSEU_000448800 [Mayamaea pseudoterrestris]|nr:hypothetical protein MPSEU_000448800 [Mayamaea pseudoterrestris]
MRFQALHILALVTSASAFTVQQPTILPSTATRAGSTINMSQFSNDRGDEMSESISTSNSNWGKASSIASALSTSALLWSASAQNALADSPDWGLFEGRTGSLLHPIMMFLMLGYSIWTALLGFNWRRQRTMGDEISALKKTLPDLQGAKTVTEALSAAKSAESVDTARVNTLQTALDVEREVEALQKERKALAAANPRDQHFAQGALLAFLGTAFAIEGPLNTYARAGKLFPGPHLYAGAGLVVLWALAAACVPAMQKGSDTARSVHIGANVAGIGLFAWQVTTGLPILFKVIEFTKWP